MKSIFRSLLVAIASALIAGAGFAAENAGNHQIVIQVSEDNLKSMNLAPTYRQCDQVYTGNREPSRWNRRQ